MRKGLLVDGVLVVMAILLLAGCSGRGAEQSSPSATPPSELPPVSAAFELDSANSSELAVNSTGSGAAVRTGEATAAVWVPAGAATDGAAWTLTALAQAPPGVGKPLAPGFYVDTADAPPSKPCVVGFALLGKVPKNATIVRIADDDATSEIVPTTRLDRSGRTLLTAAVDGFSAYAVSEEPKAAIDKAFAERAGASGKQQAFTIKASGSESQKYKGWVFEYDFRLVASGGGPEMGGVYKGSAKLSVVGAYDGPSSIVKSLGTASGIARDKKLRFIIIDAPVVSLLTGEPEGEPVVGGTGAMHLKGMGTLDMQARAPQASGRVTKKSVQGSDAVPFVLLVDGDDVRVQVPMVGIFPGKILRTTN